MGQLLVRKVDEAIIEALKREAVKNGRSAEAEHREILRRQLLPTSRRSLKAYLLAMPDLGEDRDFELRRPRARRVRL
ncbi:MAG TPA: DNA-binding protein [Polyangia bacterium]|nr:DNA-binding protein [Polyangia bacterium]